ncbi:hypothetical protein BKA65DRAFT_609527 [Rhexocercosporidium sp. MPI-PUGE-AT-0058]|nr:hypothetical protein BKA65DRAFT_609527 [Rhexocercosporidium sp. MPI-PUGE-AT-0058]
MVMADSIESADLVVIGAGWYGLSSAKTYIQIHPTHKIIILEASPSIGGVWCTSRLYPLLKSNNMVGTYENPDFPMDEATWGIKPGSHIPGPVVHDYLTAFAKKFGMLERTRFNCRVESVERGRDGWLLTKKLIVATGMTSQPSLPDFEGQEDFGQPLFHSRDFVKHQETLQTVKRVTILGGTKSAWDPVYAYATNGVHVDWVIRESGHGPCWMSPPYVTPLKKWLEKLVHTRLLTWMSPCIWGAADGYGTIRSYLHGTAIGRVVVNTFWSILNSDVAGLMKYDQHPETAKLKPWMEPFWTGNGLSIMNYPTDFLELVRSGKVKVHVADIVRLEEGKVVLSSGDVIETDAMLCATGWTHASPVKFIPSTLEAEIGLPVLPSSQLPRMKAESDFLTTRADEEILSKFPRLKNQPPGNMKFKPIPSAEKLIRNEKLSPIDLYRFMVPATEEMVARRDIAFAGHFLTLTTTIAAQIQGLWIAAYFDGKIDPFASSSPSSTSNTKFDIADLAYQTRLHNRFGKWRYPHGWAGQIPDFVFDGLPYVDLLLGDLGLVCRRKGGGWREMTEPYGPEDYVGVVDEWIEKNGPK